MPSYSGLFNGVYGQDYSLLTNTSGSTATAVARQLARKTYGAGRVRALLVALVQGGVGEPARESHLRVKAVTSFDENVQGGARPIEDFETVDRNTTQLDIDDFTAKLTQMSSPNPFPVDKSGNGGGNKLGW